MALLHPSRALALVLGVCGLACAAPASENLWTRYRGPNGSGISDAKTIPVTVTANDINWKITVPGLGYASPVVWDDKIFIFTGEKKKLKRHVIAYGTASGKELWRKSYGLRPYRMHRMNGYATATPAVDAQRLYVTWTDRTLIKLAALTHDGKEVWTKQWDGFKINHGSGASPIVVDGTVILPCLSENEKGFLIGLDAKTGDVKWTVKRRKSRGNARPKAAFSTPVLYREDGKTQVIFSSTAHGLTSLDPATGKMLWEKDDLFTVRCVACPVVVGELIVAGSGNGGVGIEFVAVRPGSYDGSRKPKLAYTMKERLPYVPSPVEYNGLLFIWTEPGWITCAKAKTGTMVWRKKVAGAGSFYSSPFCVDGKLYSISDSGRLVVVAASETFRQLGSSELGELCYATPAIAAGVMYVRMKTQLLSIGGKK